MLDHIALPPILPLAIAAKRVYSWQRMFLMEDTAMSELRELKGGKQLPHAHPDGRRCCGRPLSEKCSPEEEAAKTDRATGEKSCCKGHGHNH